MCDAAKSGQVTKLKKIVKLPKSTLCYAAITKLQNIKMACPEYQVIDS